MAKKGAIGSRPATLRDIAERVGVTITTVSKSIHDHPDISVAMREKIQQTAKELNYTPNLLASSLRRNRSIFIGLIITNSGNPYFARLIEGAQEEISSRNYHTIIIDNKEDPVEELAIVRQLRGLSIAGVMITPAKGNRESVALLKEFDIPYVLVNRYLDQDSDSYVMVDDYEAAYLATDYLIKNRSDKVLFVNAFEGISSARDRLRGYKTALLDNGLAIHGDRVYPGNAGQEAGYEVAAKILRRHELPYSILCYSDLVALGVLRFFLSSDVKVPDDVAIMGIDNIDLLSFMHPSLSTVDLPKQTIGRESAKILFDLIEDPDRAEKRLVLKPTLVVRETA